MDGESSSSSSPSSSQSSSSSRDDSDLDISFPFFPSIINGGIIILDDYDLDDTQPFSVEEIEAISVVKITEDDVSKESICSICLLEYEVGEEARMLSCGGNHKFHQICLFTWLESKKTCPMCREELDLDQTGTTPRRHSL